MDYKNKLRSYYCIHNILNPILYYKDLNIKNKNLRLKKLVLNFKIMKEKNINFFFNLIDVFYFFKLFSNKFCIKKLIIGDFKNFLKKIECNSVFCIVQVITKNKFLFIFLNFIYFFFKFFLDRKYFFNSNKFTINFNKKFNKLFLALEGILEIATEPKNYKNMKSNLFFILSFYKLFNDKLHR